MEEEIKALSEEEFCEDSERAERLADDDEYTPNYFVAADSHASCSEDEDEEEEEEEEGEEEADVSKLKPVKNAKVIDTTEEGNAFPWLVDVEEYDEILLSKHAKKLADIREKTREEMKKKKNALIFKKKAPPPFKLHMSEQEKRYVSPFYSLHVEEIPEGLLRDLNIMRLIMQSSLDDDTITAAELVMLRKKVNMSKRGFAQVIAQKSLKPPKAFKDLIRFAIQRGEKDAKRTAEARSIMKWQKKMESGKIGRAKRKAILNKVKVTRRKLNARHGHKFHRSDWNLKREMELRWTRQNKLAKKIPPPRMGNKQFLHELRSLKERIAKEEEEDGEKWKQERRKHEEKQAKVERLKQQMREEKGKISALHRMATGMSLVSEEAHEAEVRTNGPLAGNLIMFDRLTEEFEYSVSSDEEEAGPAEESAEGSAEGSDDSSNSEEEESEEDKSHALRERSWTYETVKDSSDDDSFVDYGHVHRIGPQVFPNTNVSCPTSPGEFCANAPPIVFRENAFEGVEVQSSLVAVEHAPMMTPPKPENQPRPFLTLAQRKAYFTEETEEERRKKEEEAARKRAEEERIEREKKEEEERLERLRIEEEERIAEEKRKEEERLADIKRIEDEKKAIEERIHLESEAKKDAKFAAILDQVDDDTWDKQLKIIIDRTLTTFPRYEAAKFLLASCNELGCEDLVMMRAMDEWEEEKKKERLAAGSLDYFSLKDIFDSDSMSVLRRGVKVQKKKKTDILMTLPDEVQIEDLMDTMCTFITAHIEDVTVISEYRFTSERNPIKIKVVDTSDEEEEESEAKDSLGSVVDEPETDMVKTTLEDTHFNHLDSSCVCSSGLVLSPDSVDHPLLNDANSERLKRDYAEAAFDCDAAVEGPSVRAKKSRYGRSDNNGVFRCVRKDFLDRADSSELDDEAIEDALIDDMLERELNSPSVDAVLDDDVYQESPAPISANIFNFDFSKKKGIRSVNDGSRIISNSVLKDISDQLRSVVRNSSDSIEMKEELIDGDTGMAEVKEEKPDVIEMPAIENKKMRDHFRRMHKVIDSVRVEIREKMGEVVDDEKLDQYLLDHVWNDEDNSSNVRMLIKEMMKMKERMLRSLIEVGDESSRVLELSTVGQFDRWMEDIFYLSPLSKEGRKITLLMADREEVSLHCQVVLRKDNEEEVEDDEEDAEMTRIRPEMVMKWIEDGQEKSEVVHRFPPINAIEWDSINDLLLSAREKREDDVDVENDEEQEVLFEEEGDGKGVFVVDTERMATDQHAIGDTIRFIDLELRHSARYLKYQTVGFGPRDAVVIWRDVTNRAVKAGRVMKKEIKRPKPSLRVANRDHRKSIRYKAQLNSIKQTKTINKERVEMVRMRLCEEELNQARGAVSRQRRSIRSHYKRKILAEMRDYNAKVAKVNALRMERNEMRLARRQARLDEIQARELQEEMDKLREQNVPLVEEAQPLEDQVPKECQQPQEIQSPHEVQLPQEIQQPHEVQLPQEFQQHQEVQQPQENTIMEVVPSVIPSQEGLPLFDNSLVKTEIDDDGTPIMETLTDNLMLNHDVTHDPNVPVDPLVPADPIVPTEAVESNSLAEEDEDIKPDVAELKEQMAADERRRRIEEEEDLDDDELIDLESEAGSIEALSPSINELRNYVSDDESLDSDDSSQDDDNCSETMERPDIVAESLEEEEKTEEQLIDEITSAPDPRLRREFKTVEDLSRPLNKREKEILKVLKEKRAKGESLLSINDFKKKKKSFYTPVYNGPEISILNDGSVPTMRMLLKKIKKEEGQTDEEAEERYMDAFYDVEAQLREQAEYKGTELEAVELTDSDEEEEEEEEEEEIDLDCILFHSYPDRVKRAIAKSMKKREERLQAAIRRSELYRKYYEREDDKKWEVDDIAALKKMMEEDRMDEEDYDEEEEKEKEEAKIEEKVKEAETETETAPEEKKDEKVEEDEPKEEASEEKKENDDFDEFGDKKYFRHEIPPGYCARWMNKTIDGEPMIIRTAVYRKLKRRAQLRHSRVIIGKCRGRKSILTKLHYVIKGPKSEEMIEAEEEAEIAKNNLNNLELDIDPSHVPITKEVLEQFVKRQVQSDDVRLDEKAKLIDEHDESIANRGVPFFNDDDQLAIVEEGETIETLIEEDKQDVIAMETFTSAVKKMNKTALKKIEKDPFEQIDVEIAEAVENERRILQDFLTVIQNMDSVRFQELAKQWTFDIESSDDEDTLKEKRWSRVRQFVLQKPARGPKHWESKHAYVDEWEEQNEAPVEKEMHESMGALCEDFRGIVEKKRNGYYINEQGMAVKPKKPRHFQELESDPEVLYNSDVDEMCHNDINDRLEDHLVKRKRIADKRDNDFTTRQDVVRNRGLKRKMETLKQHNRTEKNMPPLEAGLQKVCTQTTVFDAMPMTESYWTHQRRLDPSLDTLLMKRMESTRELFAAVVQPMYRTILVLRETRERMVFHNETKDLDSDDEAWKKYEDNSDSDETEHTVEIEEGQPTYVLRKRPRLCQVHEEEDDGEEGDDEGEDGDSDRASRASRASSRSDSEREDSGSEDEEDSDDPDIIIEEQPKKPKKPTLFNRVIKRELISPDFDLSKVKEEVDPEEDDDPEDSPAVIDVTPKRRPQVRKNRGRPRKSIGSGRSDSESPFYEPPPTSLRRATGKRPLISDRAAVDFYDEDEQIRLAIEESLKDQPSTSSGTF